MILPGSTMGIIGGGQLGQMIAQEAVTMGFSVIVLDPTPGCPASAVAEQIVAEYSDQQAVLQLAGRSDVVTYEFENVDAAALESARALTHLPQGTRALQICQDRGAEKTFLESAGVPVAAYRLVDSADQLSTALEEIGLPSVLKTRTGGYDGKGQIVLRDGDADSLEEAAKLVEAAPCVLERWLSFDRELSVIVAGNGTGQFRCFPPAQNEHRNNILYRSAAPAQVPTEILKRAEELATQIAEGIGLVGVMGVEMFLLPDGQILVNELAPRPHNSGHYTIEACNYSQYAAHVRGVCGWPLPEPKLLSPAIMTNVLGEDMELALAQIPLKPEWNFHFYGKAEAKEGRKMGHITVLTEDPAAAF